MATFKPFKVKVKEIDFMTNYTGNVSPIIKVFKNKNTSKHKFEAFVLGRTSDLINQNIGNHTALIIEHNPKNDRPVISKILGNDTPIVHTFPTHCKSCGTRLKMNDEGVDLICPNHICPAQSRGFLYKMMKCAVPSAQYEFIKVFLDNYPHSESNTSIDSLAEFEHLFPQGGVKNTAKRELDWQKIDGRYGSDLWRFELEVEKYLKAEEQVISSFWKSFNGPRLNDSVCEGVLSNLNPSEFIKGKDLHKYKNLPKEIREILDTNLDFVHKLVSFYSKFNKDKTWI